MFGLLTIAEKDAARRAAVECAVRDVCGVRIFEVSVLPGRGPLGQRRRLQRAARQMQRAGVRRALFPEEFLQQFLFAKYGIVAARGEYLRRMTAGKIARKLLEQNGMDPAACHVALLGDHMSAELRGALMELALMCAIPCCVPAAVAVKPVRCCVGNTASAWHAMPVRHC